MNCNDSHSEKMNNANRIQLVLLELDERHLQRLKDPFEFEQRLRTIPFCFHAKILSKKLELDRCKALCHYLLFSHVCSSFNKGSEPLHVAFNEFGKPSMEGVSFNMSNGNSIIGIFACSPESSKGEFSVGMDIASIDDFSSEMVTCEEIFSAKERALFQNNPESHWPRIHAQLWSLKECSVKYLGMGLSFESLSRLDFSDSITKQIFSMEVEGQKITYQTFNIRNNYVTICYPELLALQPLNPITLQITDV